MLNKCLKFVSIIKYLTFYLFSQKIQKRPKFDCIFFNSGILGTNLKLSEIRESSVLEKIGIPGMKALGISILVLRN